MVEHESQLKQIDLSLYRSGRELIESANAKEWAQFLEGRGNEEWFLCIKIKKKVSFLWRDGMISSKVGWIFKHI